MVTRDLAPGGITAALLGPLLAGDPHRPRLTWHGAGRTELSTATLGNWAAKTAGLLIDELGLTSGDTVEWRVRRSWQGVPLLLGAWWAGMVVTDLPGSGAVVAFVDEGDDSVADEVIVASSHPFGLASTVIGRHQRHVADAVLPQADRFAARRPGSRADSIAVITGSATLTISDVLDRAEDAATTIGRGGRVLSTVEPALPDQICLGLLGALAADGALIQVDSPASVDSVQLAVIARDEGATITLGVDGLTRLD
ncbi:MAG: TIGR03089 family protein [Nakamurella sp.]